MFRRKLRRAGALLALVGLFSLNIVKAESEVITGDATTVTDVINVVNTEITNSEVQIEIKDWSEGQEDLDLNLNDKSLTINNKSEKGSVEIVNQIETIADTGNNLGETVETGTASAVTNITNVVNTEIIDSEVVLETINILGSQSGDLILPRPEKYIQTAPPSEITLASSSAGITNNLFASANSDENSVAIINSTNIINASVSATKLFSLTINNGGGWTGNVYGWETPGAKTVPILGSQVFQVEKLNTGNNQTTVEDRSNQVSIANNATAIANTSNNSGNEVKTGDARAIVNVLNVANTSFINSKVWIGTVNILGNWTGNAIFAYPDLTTELVRINDFSYNLIYKNIGYDLANNCKISLELPNGWSSDSKTWDLGTLAAGQTGNILVSVRQDNIPGIYKVISNIETTDPENNINNNKSEININIEQPRPDPRQPILETRETNNVGQFVYPGDIVTFEIKINNKSDVPATNSVLIQKLDGNETKIFIGTIDAFKEGKVNFGIKVPDNTPAGKYLTLTLISGQAPNGNWVSSNETSTAFQVNVKTDVVIEEVPQVLGKQMSFSGSIQPVRDSTAKLFAWIIIFLLALYYACRKRGRGRLAHLWYR